VYDRFPLFVQRFGRNTTGFPSTSARPSVSRCRPCQSGCGIATAITHAKAASCCTDF